MVFFAPRRNSLRIPRRLACILRFLVELSERLAMLLYLTMQPPLEPRLGYSVFIFELQKDGSQGQASVASQPAHAMPNLVSRGPNSIGECEVDYRLAGAVRLRSGSCLNLPRLMS